MKNRISRRTVLWYSTFGLFGLVITPPSKAEASETLRRSLRATVADAVENLRIAVGLQEIRSGTLLVETTDGHFATAATQILRAALGLDQEREVTSLAIRNGEQVFLHRFLVRSGSRRTVAEYLQQAATWGTLHGPVENWSYGGFLRSIETPEFSLTENLVYEINDQPILGSRQAINQTQVEPGSLIVIKSLM